MTMLVQLLRPRCGPLPRNDDCMNWNAPSILPSFDLISLPWYTFNGMNTEISYAKLQGRYGGKFIARKDCLVLASAATYGGLIRQIRQKRLDRRTLTFGYVPPKETLCIYAW